MKELDLFHAQDKNEQLVFVERNKAITTSLKVAEYFGKRHCDVLRAISQLECSNDFRERNFASMLEIRKLQNGGTRKCEYYRMTRDGFTFLVMGFTGKVAARFKEQFINAFNEMEKMVFINQNLTFANGIIAEKIKKFNDDMRRKVRDGQRKYGPNYGQCSNLHLYFTCFEDISFMDNLDMMLTYVNNSYMHALYMNACLEQKDKEMSDLKARIRHFFIDMEKYHKIF